MSSHLSRAAAGRDLAAENHLLRQRIAELELERTQAATVESVRAARHRLAEIEAIYSSAPIGLCVLDDHCRYIRVNHQLARLNGTPADAHIGRSVEEIVPDYAVQARAAMDRLISTGEALLDFEMSGRTPGSDGVRYWNNRWVPIKDGAGKVIGASIAIEEVTERRKAIESLRESERLYRAIGDSLDWGLWIADPDGQHLYASDPILTLIGRSAEECRTLGWGDRIHPDDVSRVMELWNERIREGAGLWDAEMRLLSANGEAFPVRARGVPVRDDNGSLMCWAGILLDMRQSKAAEAALAKQVAEFETLFRMLPVGVGVARDPNCSVIRANPAFAKILGTSDENVSLTRCDSGDLPFRVLFDSKEVAPEELPMQVAARTGCEVRDFTFDVIRADGTRITEFGHAVPLFDAAGNPAGSIGTFLDLTALIETQRELERSNAELRRINADLNQFAFAATHDLQEPLRMIALYSSLLARNSSGANGDSEHALQVIRGSALRMQQLLRDLLSYIRIAIDQEEEAGNIDLNQVLETVQANLAALIQENGAAIRADPLPVVQGKDAHFVQLFQNLLSNAIKYRGTEPPAIHISAVPSPEGWQLTVADNGLGIEPQYRKKIFELFRRLHGSEVPGTGIGLATCQRVVERYGGRIWVDSKTGSGSQFCFTIPQRSAPAGIPVGDHI